jgi:hypothetical protein
MSYLVHHGATFSILHARKVEYWYRVFGRIHTAVRKNRNERKGKRQGKEKDKKVINKQRKTGEERKRRLRYIDIDEQQIRRAHFGRFGGVQS